MIERLSRDLRVIRLIVVSLLAPQPDLRVTVQLPAQRGDVSRSSIAYAGGLCRRIGPGGAGGGRRRPLKGSLGAKQWFTSWDRFFPMQLTNRRGLEFILSCVYDRTQHEYTAPYSFSFGNIGPDTDREVKTSANIEVQIWSGRVGGNVYLHFVCFVIWIGYP